MAYETRDPISIANAVIAAQAKAVEALSSVVGKSFCEAVELILSADGYVIVTGVGKSGHIGQKLAASLASTGTPAFFLHPTEASHGDLGVIRPGSVVIAISYSGQSRELIDLLRYCRSAEVPVVAISKSPESILGQNCDVLLRLPDLEEVCPNGLAPTSTTTATLVLGDALTVALMEKRGFTRDDFSTRHPGGKLGKSLHTVDDYLSGRIESVPLIEESAGFAEVVQAIAVGCQGCVGVVDSVGQYMGIITDGDLRRSMEGGGQPASAASIMTDGGTVFSRRDRIADVIDTMTQRRISNGFVLEKGKPVGLIHTKTLLAEGYI
ncbi:MAG: KpsF/GutQ family sugar-phosphate isomerase [Pseudomonadota bacterium]